MSDMLELLKNIVPKLEKVLEQREISYVDESSNAQLVLTDILTDTYFTKNSNDQLVLISKNPKLFGDVMDSYHDLEKKSICKTLKTPLVRIDVVDKLNLPSTTTYRKIDQLSDAGLIFRIKPRVYKASSEYISTFVSVTARISDNVEVAELILNPNIIEIWCKSEKKHDE